MAVAAAGNITALVLLAIGVYQWLPRSSSRAPSVAGRLSCSTVVPSQRCVAHGRGTVSTVSAAVGVDAALFVGGVMNLPWVVAITVVAQTEKLARRLVRRATARRVAAGLMLLQSR
jgi:predicted metal-binding membrane protein